jgi:hypothetical protein
MNSRTLRMPVFPTYILGSFSTYIRGTGDRDTADSPLVTFRYSRGKFCNCTNLFSFEVEEFAYVVFPSVYF